MAQSKSATPRLLFAASERDADLRYLSGFVAPDAFLLLIEGQKKTGVINRLEFARALKSETVNEWLPWETLRDKAKEQYSVERPGTAQIVSVFLKERLISCVEVGFDFPFGLALEIQQNGITVTKAKQGLAPERVVKSDTEVKAIRKANHAAAAGLKAAETALRLATIEKGKLYLEGKPLTSERLRFLVEVACLEKGAIARNTICAGGEQACDPHERGTGQLYANELIIVDVFPQDMSSGYHGDMTRTFLKGKANDRQRALVDAVKQAQQAAIDVLKAGIDAQTAHKAADSTLVEAGFRTECVNDRWQGFFHSTGHGLGLDIHEEPRLGTAKGTKLKKGMVVTVEPGLYYAGLGGCRIEDVALVTAEGCELLSKHPYRWEIK